MGREDLRAERDLLVAAVRAMGPLLDAGERLVTRFGTRDALEFVDLTMAYTKAHNVAEAARAAVDAAGCLKGDGERDEQA